MSSKKFVKSVTGGVAAVGILVSATAVLDTISSWLAMPISGWLETWLNAYKSLFFPLIDRTIGQIVGLFGYELADWFKHTIIFYFAFGAAMVRTGQQEGEIASVSDHVTLILLWPIIMGFVCFPSRMEERLDREYPEQFVSIRGLHAGSGNSLGKRGIVRAFIGEVGKLALVVIAAMLLNSAGILS